MVGFVGESCDISTENTNCCQGNSCQKISGSYCIDIFDSTSSTNMKYECKCYQGHKSIISKDEDKKLRKCVKKKEMNPINQSLRHDGGLKNNT
jgi:hypothetical protein